MKIMKEGNEFQGTDCSMFLNRPDWLEQEQWDNKPILETERKGQQVGKEEESTRSEDQSGMNRTGMKEGTSFFSIITDLMLSP